MDALDVAILRTMGLEPYGPVPQGPDALKPGTIARALRTQRATPETVRDRIQRMEQAGIIAGWQAYPNLRHLGLEAGTYLFQSDGKERATLAERLSPVEGLLAVHTFLGPQVCVDVAFRSPADLQRRLALLGQFTGDPAPQTFAAFPMPPARRALTHLDWRIVAALRGRARRSLSEVAEELGVGYRTIKRHHDRLCAEGSLWTVPMLDPGRMGAVPFWLLFQVLPEGPPDAAARVARRFQDRLLMGAVAFSIRAPNQGVLLLADSPAHVEQLRAEAAGLPGVGRTDTLVPVTLRDCSAWLDDLVAARIRETAPGAGRAARPRA